MMCIVLCSQKPTGSQLSHFTQNKTEKKSNKVRNSKNSSRDHKRVMLTVPVNTSLTILEMSKESNEGSQMGTSSLR